MFSPSFFGKAVCKSMHGYDPTLESQQGTIISNFNSDGYTNVKAPDIYDLVTASSNAT